MIRSSWKEKLVNVDRYMKLDLWSPEAELTYNCNLQLSVWEGYRLTLKKRHIITF